MLRQLAAAASGYAARSSLATLSAAAAQASAPVQRKVSIGGKPVEKVTPEKWRLRDAAEHMPEKFNPQYADEWKRSFKTMEQFDKYSEKSAPVNVGLSKAYAAWYDIPFIEEPKFFDPLFG